MNRLTTPIGLMLLALCLLSPLWAEDAVFIGDGDIASLQLFDSQGNRLEATSEQANHIAQGWIIHNPDSPILLVTPRGTINIYEDSLLVTGNLTSKEADLYLVSGKATFNTTDNADGTLTVSTPVSRYTLKGDGEMLVITTDNEESVTTFRGSVDTYNALTGAKRTVKTFQKLFMQEKMARIQTIEAGYYLTYATYPDMMLAKQVIQELSQPITAPKPVAPKAIVQEMPLPKPQTKDVTIAPLAPASSSITVAQEKPYVPSKVQVLTVEVKKLPVPEKVKHITSTILAPPPSRIIVTIHPLVPQAPSLKEAVTQVQLPPPPVTLEAKTAEDAVVVEQKTDEPSVTVTLPLAAEPDLSAVKVQAIEEQISESVAVEPQPIQTIAQELEAGQAQQQSELSVALEIQSAPLGQNGLLTSTDSNKTNTSFGTDLSYRFFLDGTNGNSMQHSVVLNPFFSQGPFSIRLQAALQTQDFQTYSNTIVPVPQDTLSTLSYVFSYIDQLRLGFSTSLFYLVFDHNRSLVNELASFTAPQFGPSTKLVAQNKLSLGSFSLVTTFDDVYLTNLLDNKGQYGSSYLQYTSQSGYPISIALGTLARFDRQPSQSINLYPLLSFRFPIINNRTTQFSALLEANGYLPAYPSFDFTQFIDTSLATFFPNYLIGVGVSVKHKAFATKVLVSLHGGKDQPLLVNDFNYLLADTSYDSTFDILSDLRWEGSVIQARLVWNLPIENSLQIADLSSAAHQADYSQFSLAYTMKTFKFGLGLANLGVLDTISAILGGTDSALNLLSGPYATSYIFAEYLFKPFAIQFKASYPVSNSLISVPQFTATARFALEKTF
jgi:hypothetical protein